MNQLNIDERFYDLVTKLWSGGSWAYYWTDNEGQTEPAYSQWFPVTDIKKVGGIFRNVNAYFGVNPSSVKKGMRERTELSDIQAVNCLFAEFDLSTPDDAGRMLNSINDMDCPPSVIIFSGGGYHCYWLLSSTYHIHSEAERNAIIAIQYAWNKHVGADGAAKDIARVLRIPGALNRKAKYAPSYPTVKIKKFEMDTAYDLSDLQSMVQSIIDEDKKPVTDVTTVASASIPIDIDQRLLKMLTAEQESADLFSGDMSKHENDHSKADLALCNRLAWWLGKDKEMINQAFRRSGLYREKWERADYRNKTIDRAIADTKGGYNPQALRDIGDVAGLVNLHANKATAEATISTERVIDGDGWKSTVDMLLHEKGDDEGNAQCVHALSLGKFLHCPALGWLYYTDTHWESEGGEAAVERAITKMLDKRIKAAMATGDKKYDDLIRKCQRMHSRVNGIKGQLEAIVYTSIGDFESNPDMINCLSGVIDLRTGEVIAHSPTQRFLSCAPVTYNPTADYSRWDKWLEAATTGDDAMYLKLAVGYSLTGHTSEEVMFYLWGPPRSGKGTFTTVISEMIGDDLSKAVPFSTFTARADVDSQNFALAPLKSSRIIVASESDKAERLNAAKVKTITGGDKIRCAFKGKDQFDYRPQFKIWLTSNFFVNADVDDSAVWGRIRTIEFPNSHLDGEDKGMKIEMRQIEYLESVFAWAVQGAIDWYKLGAQGLPELRKNAEAKQKQRDDQDSIVLWVNDTIALTGIETDYLSKSMIYSSYKNWCVDNGKQPKAVNTFSHDLINKPQYRGKIGEGRQYIDTNRARVFTGIKLKPD